MATHSSILAWRIPGMGEPGGLPSMDGLKHVSLPYPSPYLSSPRNSQESSSTPQFESINSSVQID